MYNPLTYQYQNKRKKYFRFNLKLELKTDPSEEALRYCKEV